MSLTQRTHENGHTGAGLGSKLDVFGDKRELPMYKDKPYNYSGSRRHVPYYRRRRVISGVILVVIGLAYSFGLFSSPAANPRAQSPSRTSWSWLGGSEKVVDWDYRREKVKEAFMVSWDGYEKYAWGMSSTLRAADLGASWPFE